MLVTEIQMKRFLAIALLTMVVASSSMAADQTAPAGQTVTATETPTFDQQMRKMQEQMKLMQEQMQKIDAAKDEAEKKKLLDEHWMSMQQGMQMMRGMSQSGMMGPMRPGMTTDQIAQHQQMMGQFMGMQQMMMQHMWGHQSCMSGNGSMMGHHGMMNMWQ